VTKLTLIRRGKPHHNNVLGVFVVRGASDLLQYLIVDDGGIGVIDGAVTAEEQLRVFLLLELRRLFVQEFAELVIGIDHVGNTWRVLGKGMLFDLDAITFGGVEAGDLDEVVAVWPVEFSHLLLGAEATELSHIILGIPRVELLVETIKPLLKRSS